MTSRNDYYQVDYTSMGEDGTIFVKASDVPQACKAASVKLISPNFEIVGVRRHCNIVSKDLEINLLERNPIDVLVMIAHALHTDPAIRTGSESDSAKAFFYAALCLEGNGYDLAEDLQKTLDRQYDFGTIPYYWQIDPREQARPIVMEIGQCMRELGELLHEEWLGGSKYKVAVRDAYEFEPFDPDAGVDFKNNALAYCFLLAAGAAVTNDHEPEEYVVATYSRILPAFAAANGLTVYQSPDLDCSIDRHVSF